GDGRERKLRDGGRARFSGDVPRRERFDADGAEIAEVAASDGAETDDSELHTAPLWPPLRNERRRLDGRSGRATPSSLRPGDRPDAVGSTPLRSGRCGRGHGGP